MNKTDNRLKYKLIKSEPGERRRDPAPMTKLPSTKLGHGRGQVVFAAVGPYGFNGPGKVRAKRFFPPFVEIIDKANLYYTFVDTEEALCGALEFRNSAVVYIYNEEIIAPGPLPAQLEGLAPRVSFNDFNLGRVISDKIATNMALSAANVPVPRMANMGSNFDAIFSNEVSASKGEVKILTELSDLDFSRYNTEFVDTRVEFAGRVYFTSVRAICVGGELVHSFVRARHVGEGSPAVHARDTPLDPGLIEYLQETLVTSRINEIKDLCRSVSLALGAGFFAHDILVCSDTGNMCICEVGFKFEDAAYTKHLSPISDRVMSHSMMFEVEFGRRSAEAFLRECQRLDIFLS